MGTSMLLGWTLAGGCSAIDGVILDPPPLPAPTAPPEPSRALAESDPAEERPAPAEGRPAPNPRPPRARPPTPAPRPPRPTAVAATPPPEPEPAPIAPPRPPDPPEDPPEAAPAVAPPSDAAEPPPNPSPKRSGPHPIAGVRVATAYAFRGLNVFGQTQGETAGLLAPTLQLEAGAWSFGWLGLFQAWGPEQDELVRKGVGLAQDAFAGVGHPFGKRLRLDARLWLVSHPFATDPDANRLLVEPWISARVDLGLSLTATLIQRQGAPAASYTYGQLALGRSLPFSGRASLALAASGGAKHWNLEPRDRANTWDLDLGATLELRSDPFGFYPTAHLTWTNLPDLPVRAGAFAWAGLESRVRL